MGIKNYLIEGVSGTGKTSIATKLEAMGFDVVHGDRTLAYQGDKETGAPVKLSQNASAKELHNHHIWDIEKLPAHMADKSSPATFFCGGARNHHKFIKLFDLVFILKIDEQSLKQRLANRPADEFGGQTAEQALILKLNRSQSDTPRSGIPIDATQPINLVIEEILRACRHNGALLSD